MKILITGRTGFTAGLMLKCLAEAGYELHYLPGNTWVPSSQAKPAGGSSEYEWIIADGRAFSRHDATPAAIPLALAFQSMRCACRRLPLPDDPKRSGKRSAGQSSSVPNELTERIER